MKNDQNKSLCVIRCNTAGIAEMLLAQAIIIGRGSTLITRFRVSGTTSIGTAEKLELACNLNKKKNELSPELEWRVPGIHRSFTIHPPTVYRLNSPCVYNAGLKQMFTPKSE